MQTIPAVLSRVARLARNLANTLIALVILIFVGHAVNSWYGARTQSNDQLDAIASLMKRTLDTYLVSKQAGMRSLVDTIEDAGGLHDLQRVQQLLSTYKSHRVEISETYISDLNGQILASSRSSALQDLTVVDNLPAYITFLQENRHEKNLHVDKPQIGKASDRWNLVLRLVLRDRDDQPIAVLSDVLQTGTLVSFWRDAVTYGTLSVGVIRDDSYLLDRFPLPSSVNLNDLYGKPRSGALAQYLQTAAHPMQGQFEGPSALAGGEIHYNYFKRLDKFPLTVFAAQPVAQIHAAWLSSLMPSLVVMLLFIAAAQWAVRRIAVLDMQMSQQRMDADAASRRNSDEQRFLVDRLMTGLVMHDASGVVIRCNVRATQLLGLTLEQMAGKALIDASWRFLREDESVMPVAEYPVAQVLFTRQPVIDYVVGVIRPDTIKVTWLLCRADPWFDDAKQLIKTVVTFADITARRALEMSIREKDQRFKALFEHSMDAVLMTATNGSILEVNPAGCKLFGMTESQIIASGRKGIVDTTDPRLADLMARREKEGSATGLLTMKKGDGTRFTAELSSSTYLSSNGESCSSMVVRDMTERLLNQERLEHAYSEMHKANESLDQMAHFDALTHLPNRVLLADRMQQAILHATRRNKSVGVAFLDLDGFKEINDNHGHAVGDKLLIAVANRLKLTLREGDTLSRLGGDEFVAVFSDLNDQQDLQPFLARLLAVASERILVEDINLQVSASIGVTVFPQDGASPEQLLRHADQAMYVAKQAGKNRFHLYDVASEVAHRSHREQLDLIAQGMQRKQFMLYYQPQVNMLSGEVIGMEALVRWDHPERGVLGPGQFLPALENDPMAMDFGDMLLDIAMQQLAVWQQLGFRFKLSVNLFNQQIQEPAFPDRLRSMMDRYPQLLSNSLKLEIVETNALTDIAMVSNHMLKCIAMGVHFAVDDFGTGYSSLTYLKRLPAQQLKIDQTFVRSMLTDREDLAIVQGVIGLAKAFDRQVIAEGVETVEQAESLVRMGCLAAQGFGIGEPMHQSALKDWLADWSARQPWTTSIRH